MAQTYTRQSSFADGDTITAALFNNEYNQLVNAFAYSSSNASTTGHRHDGTAGQGGNIPQIGDLDFLNKIVVDTTNNRWGIFVEVSGSAVEQIRFQDGALLPVTDSDVDLGTSSLYFKDAFIDSITTTGNVAVGGNLTVTGTTTFNGGTITMGDAATDNVVFGADVDSNIIPDDDNTYDLGSSSQEWKDLYVDGIAYLDGINFDGTAITATAAELNILDGVTSTAAELNILDGVTSTTAELNILDGVTSTTAELNILDGVTATAAEINALDGITSTVAELNILDGVTASATDINLIDGITNGTVIASKAIITDSNKDITGGRNITISGQLAAATLDISGDVDVDGTLEADAITVNGTTLAETISDTVGAMVTSNTETGVTVTYDDSDNTLDFVIGTLNQDTTGNAATATALETARTIHGVSFDGTANIDLTEVVQDTVGAMFSSNTETGLAVTYEDSDGTIDVVLAAAQPTVTSLGTLTTLSVDNITINGNDISSTDSDGDILFKGNDGGSTITALTLDMSNAGSATFNKDIFIGDGNPIRFGDDQDGRVFYDDTNGFIIQNSTSDKDILFKGNDGGATVTALTLDMSDAGTATFNHDIELGDSGIARFGAGSDLKIQHNGTNSFIDNETGALYIRNKSDDKDVIIQSDDGSGGLTDYVFADGSAGSVNLYHYGSAKLSTTSSGVDITGTVTATELNIAEFLTSTNVFESNVSGQKGARLRAAVSDASTPTFSFHDDTNTGMYSSGADTLNFSTAGSEALRIDSSGNLLVGKTSSDLTTDGFEVRPTGFVGVRSNGDPLYLNRKSTDGAIASFAKDGTTIGTISTVSNRLAIGSNDVGLFFDSTNERFTPIDQGNLIDRDATIDLGYASSRFKDLYLSGQINSTKYDLHNEGSGSLFQTDGYLRFANGSTETVRIDASGNVGIGTTSPGQKLDVSGNITADAFIGRSNISVPTGDASIFRVADNTLAFATASTERVRITSAGRVGIGETDPDNLLHLKSSDDTLLKLESTDTTVRLALTDSAGTSQVKNTGGKLILEADPSNATSNSYLGFEVDGSEVSRFDSSGNLGIGTTSPDDELDVEGADPAIRLTDTSASGYARLFANNGSLLLQSDEGNSVSNSIIGFDVDGTERMRINSSGNVGIGTTNPANSLHVVGGINVQDTNDPLVLERYSASSNGPFTFFLKSRNATVGSNTVVQSGDSLGGLLFKGADGDEFIEAARIEAKIDGTPGNNDMPGRLVFSTTADGAASITERMRIDSSGNVGIGTASPSEPLHVNEGTGGVSTTLLLQNSSASVDGRGTNLTFKSSSTEIGQIQSKTSSDATSGILAFKTASSGTLSEQMRIDKDGNVGIGTTSPSFSAGTGLEISRAGAATLRVTDSDGTTGSTELVQVDADGYLLTRQSGSLILGTNDTERMRINSSGNVGIGTTSPAESLHTTGNIRFGDSAPAELYTNSSEFRLGVDRNNDNDTSNITFYTNNSEKVRIDKDGDVGIGTTSPSHNLHVFADSGTTQGITSQVNNGNAANFQFEKARGGSGGPSVVQSGDDLGNLVFTGYDGNSYASAATIKGEVDGTPGDGDMPGRLSFRTSADGSESPSERMRIDSSGVVMIGTTDSTQFNNTSGSGIAIHPTEIQVASTNNCLSLNHSDGDGDIAKFFRSGSQVGSISVASSSTTYATSSDARLKDVTGSARGLEVINELNPVAYNWKADGKADEGLIAQEVLDVVPNAVSGSKEDMYQMDYSKLVVHLVAGMKEQQEQIEALQSEINELKNS